MSAESNKKITEQFLTEVFISNNPSSIDKYISPDYMDHTPPPGIPTTIEGFKMLAAMGRSAFPDFTYKINNIIAEDDMVVAYLTASGTMKGDFMGMPATGKTASWDEIHIGKMVNGKFIGHWTVIDQFGMLTQLGLMSMPQSS